MKVRGERVHMPGALIAFEKKADGLYVTTFAYHIRYR